MRDLFYSKQSLLTRTLILLAAILAFGWNSAAADIVGSGTEADPYMLEVGGSYPIGYGSWYAEFTVPEDVTTDGTVLEVKSGDREIECYSDAAHTVGIAGPKGNSSPYSITVSIPNGTKQGTKFYFYKASGIQGGTFEVLSYGAPIPLTCVAQTPAAGSTIGVNNLVSLEFNKSVAVTKCYMTIGQGTTETVLPYTITNDKYVGIDPTAALKSLYDNGDVSEGDEIHIRLDGVKTQDNAETLEPLDIVYYAASKPTSLSSTVNTPGNGRDVITSWIAKDDYTGLVQLVFDGPLDTNTLPTAKLSIGNPEVDGGWAIVDVPVQFFGDNILAIDLRGEKRTKEALGLTAEEGKQISYEEMTLTVSGVTAADGTLTYTTVAGSTGGQYSFAYTYQEIIYNPTVDISLLPENTTNFDDATSIDYYIMEEGGVASFTGIKFAYVAEGEDNSVVVPLSMASYEEVAPNTHELVVAIPEFTRDENTNVIVSLEGLSSPDGEDYSAMFTKSYTTAGHVAVIEDMQVTMAHLNDTEDPTSATSTIDLLNIESLELLPSDHYLNIATNKDDKIGFLVWDLVQLVEGGEPLTVKSASAGTSAKTDDGHWNLWIPGFSGYKLFAGNTYQIRVFGWTSEEARNLNEDMVGSAAVNIKGACEEYQYSTTTLVDPYQLLFDQNEANFSLTSAEDNQISFTFSDAVTVNKAFVVLGSGMTQDCACTLNEDQTTVTLTIPEFILTSYDNFPVSLQVTGADGHIVQGNNGEEDDSYISVYVDAKFNLPEVNLIDPAEGSNVKQISTLKFGYSEGIDFAWLGNIEIRNRIGEVVATSKGATTEQIVIDGKDYYEEVTVTLAQPITEEGYYAVIVPEGYFNLGTMNQGGAKNNREAVFSLIVGATPLNMNIDPVPGSTVANLKDFIMTFYGDMATWTDWSPSEPSHAPYVKDAKGNTYPATGDYDWYDNNDNGIEDDELTISLNETITASGEYTLVLPAGCLTINGKATTDEYTYNYTIEAPENITIDPAEGSVESLSTFEITFNDHEMVGWGNGNPYMIMPDASIMSITNTDIGEAWNALIVNLPETLTADGTYTLVLPAGCVNYESNSNASDISFRYVIGADVISDPQNGATVRRLQNIVLTFPSTSSVDWNYEATSKMIFTDAHGIQTELTGLNHFYPYDMNQLGIALSELYTEAGTYTLFVPGDYIYDNDKGDVIGKDMVFTWTLKPWDITITPENLSTVEQLSAITLQFNDFSEADGVGYDDTMEIYFTAGSNSISIPTKLIDGYVSQNGYPWNKITITLPDGPYTQDGNYSLCIPENWVYDFNNPTNKVDQTFNFYWTIGTSTSIADSFATEGTTVNVYTSDGIELMKNAEANRIKTLKPGLYIINGKKYIIRK
ncbi:MAG: hypothetical protein ACI350_06385 [Prevotella sp.]